MATSTLPHSDDAFRKNNFDLIRVGAALQVLLFHTAHHLKIALPFWLAPLEHLHGVPIFFATSGFLISASYERRAELRRYFRNRFLRIYPALWALLLGTVAVVGVIGNISFWHPTGAVWLFSQAAGFIYTPSFLQEFGFGSYNGSLWTIPIELQFYVLLPLLYWVGSKCQHLNLFLGVVWVAALGLAILWLHYTLGEPETPSSKLIRYSFLPHLHLFVFGVLLQRLHAFRSPLIRGKAVYWLVGYMALAMLLPETPSLLVGKSILLALTSLSVAYSLPSAAHTLLRGHDLSYGIYIYHGLIVNVFVEYNWFYMTQSLVAVLLLTLACSYISWVGLEFQM